MKWSYEALGTRPVAGVATAAGEIVLYELQRKWSANFQMKRPFEDLWCDFPSKEWSRRIVQKGLRAFMWAPETA